MSKDKNLDADLRLMEVSQDCMSEAYINKHNTRFLISTQYADEYADSWGGDLDGDDFIDIEEIVDADMDAEILDLDDY